MRQDMRAWEGNWPWTDCGWPPRPTPGAFLSVLSYCLVRRWGLSQPDSSLPGYNQEGSTLGSNSRGRLFQNGGTTPGASQWLWQEEG